MEDVKRIIETIYIAGKVTGRNYDEAYSHFERVEILLRRQGFRVVNPMRLVHKPTSWHDAMRVCIPALINCDAVYMLNGFHSSKGASIEMVIASLLGMPIDFEVNGYPFQNIKQN